MTDADPAVAVQLIAVQGLIALALVAILWPEMRRATDLAAAVDGAKAQDGR